MAVIVAIGLAGGLLSDAITTEIVFVSDPDSKRADELLEDRLRGPMGTNEIVVVRSAGLTVEDPAFEVFVRGLAVRVGGGDVLLW